MEDQQNYLTTWRGEITAQVAGPLEGEVSLTVRITGPERRAGRLVRVIVHRDALADMLMLAEQ